MNTLNGKLFLLAVLLMIAGGLSAYSPLLLLGFILIFPALFLRGNRKMTEPPKAGMTKAETESGTSTAEPAVNLMQPAVEIARPEEYSMQAQGDGGVTPPLFPYSILPTLGPVNVTGAPPQQQKKDENKEKDELVELAVLLGLNWLASRLWRQGT